MDNGESPSILHILHIFLIHPSPLSESDSEAEIIVMLKKKNYQKIRIKILKNYIVGLILRKMLYF